MGRAQIQAVSRSDPDHPAVAHTLLTVAPYESHGRIGMLLGATHFSVIPGSTIHVPILLLNRGLQEDSFRLGVSGIPTNWISINSPTTQLAPAESKEVMVTIHVPRSPQAAAGRTPFVIQFSSQMFPDESTEVSCILTVAAFSQFSASLEPVTLEAGQPGRVIVSNEGNTVDTYSLNFQSAKVSHLGHLPQGQPERYRRALRMVAQMDLEHFGGCTLFGECQEACPKEISIDTIARLNRTSCTARWQIPKKAREGAGQARQQPHHSTIVVPGGRPCVSQGWCHVPSRLRDRRDDAALGVERTLAAVRSRWSATGRGASVGLDAGPVGVGARGGIPSPGGRGPGDRAG